MTFIPGFAVIVFATFLALRAYERNRMAQIMRSKSEPFASGRSFNVFFNFDGRIAPNTPLNRSTLTLLENGIELESEKLVIPFDQVRSCRLEYPHSKVMRAHVIELGWNERVAYFAVTRHTLFNIFVSVNVAQTSALFEELKKKLGPEVCKAYSKYPVLPYRTYL